MSKETMKLALGKIKSARDCHLNAVDTLLFEAEEILETALAEQPAQRKPLTDEEIEAVWKRVQADDFHDWPTAANCAAAIRVRSNT